MKIQNSFAQKLHNEEVRLSRMHTKKVEVVLPKTTIFECKKRRKKQGMEVGERVSEWWMNWECVAMELREILETVMWPIKSLSIDVHGLLLEWFYNFPAPLMWMEMRLRLQECFFLFIILYSS